MKKYTALAGILAAGLATITPQYSDALEMCLGCEYTRSHNSVGIAPILMEEIAPGSYEVRVVLEQRYDTDTYRVLLRERDTLPSVVGLLQRACSTVTKRQCTDITLETVVRENGLRGNRLPSLRSTRSGERPTASVTYTRHVNPPTPGTNL